MDRTVPIRGVDRTKWARNRGGCGDFARVRGREELLEMANRRIPLTQVQVAELLGVSRNVVHRVEQDAQAKIKEALEEQPE